ncbi:MAG: D-glycero-alpha-D-manno-heptose-1,7-bisphosphate 7-phosphatase [Janthinobacterium lividum]
MLLEAVFLDRDGVLNPHIPGGYLLSANDVRVMPGVAQAVRHLNDAGLPVILISNQQGVGKGVMSHDDLAAIEARMASLLMQEAGAHLDRCYYSTELAAANSPRRKPQPGMLQEAAADFGLTLANTVFAGDSRTDIEAGHAAGVGKTALLLSGGIETYAAGDFEPAPDLVFSTLMELADWLLEHEV